MAKEPSSVPGPVPGPEKIEPGSPAAGTPIVETASPTIDRRTGEPVSAEVRPEPVRRRDPLDELRVATMPDPTSAGTLPATTRVLPSGRSVSLKSEPVDTRTREFTAAIRILQGKVLFEPGAPVPLTYAEFIEKRALGAITERHWDDGYLPEV